MAQSKALLMMWFKWHCLKRLNFVGPHESHSRSHLEIQLGKDVDKTQEIFRGMLPSFPNLTMMLPIVGKSLSESTGLAYSLRFIHKNDAPGQNGFRDQFKYFLRLGHMLISFVVCTYYLHTERMKSTKPSVKSVGIQTTAEKISKSMFRWGPS